MKMLRSAITVVVAVVAISCSAVAMLALGLTVSGAVGPATAQTAAVPTGQLQRLTGTLRSVERLLNVPGARCGWHFDLTVEVAGQGQQLLHVYDMRVSEASLTALEGRKVEIDFGAGEIVASVRSADGRDAVALSGLSVVKHC
jgi:hypothetical protein